MLIGWEDKEGKRYKQTNEQNHFDNYSISKDL